VLPPIPWQANAQGEILPKAIRRFLRDHRLPQDQGLAEPHPTGISRPNIPNYPPLAEHITYSPTREGWLYLAAVLDAYSRALVGLGDEPNAWTPSWRWTR